MGLGTKCDDDVDHIDHVVHVDHDNNVDLHIVAWHVNQRGSPTLCAPKSSWRRPG